MATTYKNPNVIGSTTKGAATGGALAGAVGTLAGYALIKTGFETDPVVAATLAGAVVTMLSAVGALIGGKLSPTDQGNPAYAAAAVEQVQLIAERLAAVQATGPVEYAPSAGEEPVTEPVTDDEPGPITEPEDTGGVWAQLGHPELDTTEGTTDR